MKRVFLYVLTIILFAFCSSQPSKPVIGISAGYSDFRNTVRDEYANAVERAGGIPVLIPLAYSDEMAAEYMKVLDGFILSGGEDIQPAYYGEEVLNESVDCNIVRDTSDFRLLEAALSEGIPMLAICRGEQIANVYFGGKLYQDIPSQVDGCLDHSQDTARHVPQHMITIERGSRLYELLGVDSIAVNSFHHQAVKDLGEALKLSAVAPDGIVEGFEKDDILFLQFHPESFISAGDDTFLPIFEDLVSRAREGMKSRPSRR